MARFPHLEIRQTIDGQFKSKKGGPRPKSPITVEILGSPENRKSHGDRLLANVSTISDSWLEKNQVREVQGLPALPEPDVIPIFLQIDTNEFDIESLEASFGIEIIAEEEEGFIIGASSDNFKALKEKIDIFLANQEGRKFQDKAAQLWKVVDGDQWRIDQILSPELVTKWDQIADDAILVVDLGIACYIRIPKQPNRGKNATDEQYEQSVEKWLEKKDRIAVKRDESERVRQTGFERLLTEYGGQLLSSYVGFDDSFSCRIKISGKGLKDIVLNYQYLFEVTEHENISGIDSGEADIGSINPELVAPDADAPCICIIDSGIQEEHRLIALAIDHPTSRSFVPGDDSVADISSGGGHGTRVAGAVLYPNLIPRNGQVKHQFRLQNARILIQNGENTLLPESLYPPELMEKIVDHFSGTRIFNMSINSYGPCKTTHMSQWASAIDMLMEERDILFILSAGNISRQSGSVTQPGIKEHLQAGREYPGYLIEQDSSRVANPSQSCFSLTVGSICIEKFDTDLKESFGKKDDPSPFSRTGLGLWGMIKPDVVEYGGDFAREKNVDPNISNEPNISPELVKSIYHGGSGVGRDSVGTSYAAPKVTNIAAHLQRLYPVESCNLYRALIVQSARLPDSIFGNPNLNHIRHYGYGIPDLKRATENSEKRITLIASNNLAAKRANVYSIRVPAEMRRPGEDFDILLEVTLSFTARPRRTRRRTKSYLSTWVDWESSKLNETYEQFANRILQDIDAPGEAVQNQDSIQWLIRERKDWSPINGIRRQDNSLQKSWCVMKSYELPEILSLAVVGHKGWEYDLNEEVEYSLAVSFEALTGNINVYEMIRIENHLEIPVEEVEEETRVEVRA